VAVAGQRCAPALARWEQAVVATVLAWPSGPRRAGREVGRQVGRAGWAGEEA
jgi:hypothetical protein